MPARRTFGQQSESKRVLKGFETTEFGVRSFINFRSVEHIQRNSVVKPIKGLISQNRKGRCWVYFYGTPLSPPVGVFSQYFYEGKCCCKGPDVCEFIDFRRRQQIVEGKKDPISRFGLGIGPVNLSKIRFACFVPNGRGKHTKLPKICRIGHKDSVHVEIQQECAVFNVSPSEKGIIRIRIIGV